MRKGITPVVAMVLLLMMTVAAAGAAYVWTQGLIGGQTQEGTQAANTELTAREVTCSGTSITVTVSNTGSVPIDASSTDVFVRDLTGSLHEELTGENLGTLSPGSSASLDVSLTSGLNAQTSYDITYEFADFEWSTTCEAE